MRKDDIAIPSIGDLLRDVAWANGECCVKHREKKSLETQKTGRELRKLISVTKAWEYFRILEEPKKGYAKTR